MRVPSVENTAHRTTALCGRVITSFGLRALTSHTFADMSDDAVTTRLPSAENSAEYIQPSWQHSSCNCLPVAAPQMRAVLSNEAVTTRAPSGENAADLTEPS